MEGGEGGGGVTMNDAAQCRRNLASRGIEGATRRWLVRLVTMRKIVAVPIANVLGFHRGLARTAEAVAHRGGYSGGGYGGNGGYDDDGDDPDNRGDAEVDGGGGMECDYLLLFRWNNSPPSSSSLSSVCGAHHQRRRGRMHENVPGTSDK